MSVHGDLMYSEKILAAFKKHGIEPGDTIKISSANETFEGELMPKTDAGEKNTIILKLKNGYNAGILYNDDVKLEILSAVKREEQHFAKLKPSSSLPNVTVLWTGGTIGSRVGYKSGGVAAIVKPEELLYYIPELAGIANIEVENLFNVWSDNMTSMEWQKMAMATAKALKGGARGVVIAQGTDTMHYTSAALSFMLQELNAPVIITGAQRSGDRGSSDAFINLICAVQLAAKSDIAEVGICMHEKSSDDKCIMLRGTKVRKMHTSRRDAFKPINVSPIAAVTPGGDIRYIGKYRKINSDANSKLEPKTGFEQRVAIVKVYPDSDPDILDYYVKKGFKGIIIEGTGLGHIPTAGKSWLQNVKDAIKKGTIIGITSQCLNGRVNPNVYEPGRIISGAGAVYCEDMLPETAYIKLGWLLANRKEEAKEMLAKNLVGEISERIEYEEKYD